MDLSAVLIDFFNPDNFAGHLAYILVIISMMMRTMFWLRLFALLSGVVAVAYFVFARSDYVVAFWEVGYVTVNMVQIFLLWYENRQGQFTAVQKDFVANGLMGLRPVDAARVVQKASVETVPAGTRLLTEGDVPDKLVYLISGQVRIERDGHQIGRCVNGDFVGEMAIISNAPANADVVCETDCETLVIDRAALASLTDRYDAIRHAVQAGMSSNLLAKINRMNDAALASARGTSRSRDALA